MAATTPRPRLFGIPTAIIVDAGGRWVAISPRLPDRMYTDATEDGVRQQVLDAGHDFIMSCLRNGDPVPDGIRELQGEPPGQSGMIVVSVDSVAPVPKTKKLIDTPVVSTIAVAWLAGSTAHEAMGPLTTSAWIVGLLTAATFAAVICSAHRWVEMSNGERCILKILGIASILVVPICTAVNCTHSVPLQVGEPVATASSAGVWRVTFDVDAYRGSLGGSECVALALPDDGDCVWIAGNVEASGAPCIRIDPVYPVELEQPQTVVNVNVRAAGEMCNAEVSMDIRCTPGATPQLQRSECDPLGAGPRAEGVRGGPR